jgi:hypothetical protein
MAFPKTVVVTGTTNGDWNVINAPMFSPTHVSFNVTQSGTTSWSIQLTNTNILAGVWQMGGQPAGGGAPVPVTITPKTYAAPAALTTQVGAAVASVDEPFFAWRVVNTGTGTVTVEALEGGEN